MLQAEMTVGYRAIRETFVSRVILDLAGLQVDAGSPPGIVTGPFRQLHNRWNFAPTLEGCDVRFFISYEFRSLMLQMLVGSLFDRVFRRYTLAFEDRARTVYGPSGAHLVSGAKARQGR
jgi:coenzyme Q-binding protein COQ10